MTGHLPPGCTQWECDHAQGADDPPEYTCSVCGSNGDCPPACPNHEPQEIKMMGEGWVPVHPTEGTDWGAFTLDEDETHGMNLVPGYEWKRCLIAIEPRTAEFAWVIEKGSGSDLRYYAPTEPGEWTKDHLKACRFSRKEDAEACQFRNVTHGRLKEYDTRVCEHGWH